MENEHNFIDQQEYEPVDFRKKISWKIAVAGAALSLIFSAVTIGTYFSHRSEQQSAEAASVFGTDSSALGGLTTDDTSWVPAGYTAWSNDSTVAWKWAQGSCSEYTCNHATFISENGCSNFYAAVNFLDASGSVIGYGNATLPSLQPMQTATLEFDDTSDSSKTAEMSQINCY